jgi:hypothetical protein
MLGVSEIIAGVALLVSGYNLWQGKLRRADLKVFVPPVIQYKCTYKGNFEAFEIPVTLANEGAQTGTVLSIELEVTDPKTKAVKRFYSANFGQWVMETVKPFAPISLAGHARQTETVLFYTRGEEEKPDQIVSREPGAYAFRLILDDGSLESGRRPPSVEFARELREYDARWDTMPMYAQNWRSAVNA